MSQVFAVGWDASIAFSGPVLSPSSSKLCKAAGETLVKLTALGFCLPQHQLLKVFEE